jgi:hypothetical protein
MFPLFQKLFGYNDDNINKKNISLVIAVNISFGILQLRLRITLETALIV